MNTIALLDTSEGSTNKGDEIIMRCIYEEFKDVFSRYFLINTPTHLIGNSFSQSIGAMPDSASVISSSKYKLVCGTNLLSSNMLHRTNQWNINIFNCRYIQNSILVGVGSCEHNAKVNSYTKFLYKKTLSNDFIHSVREDTAEAMMKSMGFKVLNTRCVTMWKLTEDFCHSIPTYKSENAIFTLTDYCCSKEADIFMINTLLKEYKKLYFWPQGIYDTDYLCSILAPNLLEQIIILPPNVDNYENILATDVDYIGTRLHAGIYALRHGKRSIILSVDQRMKSLKQYFCGDIFISRNNIDILSSRINSCFKTTVDLDIDAIDQFKTQFI